MKSPLYSYLLLDHDRICKQLHVSKHLSQSPDKESDTFHASFSPYLRQDEVMWMHDAPKNGLSHEADEVK